MWELGNSHIKRGSSETPRTNVGALNVSTLRYIIDTTRMLPVPITRGFITTACKEFYYSEMVEDLKDSYEGLRESRVQELEGLNISDRNIFFSKEL